MLSAAAAGHSVAASTTSSGSSVSCNTNGHTKAEMSMASASSSGNGSPEAAAGEELPNGVNGGCEQDQDEQRDVRRKTATGTPGGDESIDTRGMDDATNAMDVMDAGRQSRQQRGEEHDEA